MSRYTFLSILVAFCMMFLVSGCKSDDEKAVEMFEEMADIIDSNKDDCEKMASELKTWWDDNGDDLKAIKDKTSDEVPKEYEERIEKATEKMMGGIIGCADNSDVQEVFGDIGSAME